jgi:hypothetical protein
MMSLRVMGRTTTFTPLYFQLPKASPMHQVHWHGRWLAGNQIVRSTTVTTSTWPNMSVRAYASSNVERVAESLYPLNRKT